VWLNMAVTQTLIRLVHVFQVRRRDGNDGMYTSKRTVSVLSFPLGQHLLTTQRLGAATE